MKSNKKFILSINTLFSITCLILVATFQNQVTEGISTERDYSGLDYDDFDQRKLERFFDDEYNQDYHEKGRVFYSHSMMAYGTEDEQVEKELIRNAFSDFGLVNPKFHEGDDEKMQDDMNSLVEVNNGMAIEETEFYKIMVSSCQMLVYSKWKNEITSGVAIEVNHAIDIGIPVFELVDDKFLPQKVHVERLSYEDTVRLYQDN